MRHALNMAIMASGGLSCAAIKETRPLIKEPHAEVAEGTMCGFEFPGQTMVRAALERHPAMVQEILTDSCLPCHNGTANDRRHAGGAEVRVHHNQNRRHLRPERHLRHMGIMSVLQVLKWKVCHPDMCIYILLFPALNFSILMHMATMASMIQILCDISWLMKEDPQVSTLSAAWKCSWHLFCRREHPIERTWQWRCTKIERNGIFEYYYYLLLADTLKYILKNIFVQIIKEQCSDQGKCRWKWWNCCQNTMTDILCQIQFLYIADTPVAQWASTEHQRFLVLHLG